MLSRAPGLWDRGPALVLSDGASQGATQGPTNAWIQRGNPGGTGLMLPRAQPRSSVSLPVRLPCHHVLGSKAAGSLLPLGSLLLDFGLTNPSIACSS